MSKRFFFIYLVLILVSCNDRLDWLPDPAPKVNDITPTEGTEGTEVVIKGDNFSTKGYDNQVSFNGVPATILKSARARLLVVAPNSTTGPVTVSVKGQSARKRLIFEYQ